MFEAWTVKVKMPVAVGVPEILPDASRVRPSGSEPSVMLHVIGVAPIAVRSAL